MRIGNKETLTESFNKFLKEEDKKISSLSNKSKIHESFEPIQYWGSKNQYGYSVRQLKIDYTNKTYAVGSFKQSVDKKVTNKAISEKIEELKMMGFKEETEESLHEEDEQCIDIQYILDDYEYPPEIEPEEMFNSDPDSSYFKVVRDAHEAEKFNYQSDYWGSADSYQEEMVGLLEELENYIVDGTTLCMYDDGAEIKFKVTGVAIDKQYNSISHAKILFKEVGTVKEGSLNEDTPLNYEDKKPRLIPIGLSDDKSKDVINAVVGQMSDGMWENSPGMERYWKFTDGLDNKGNIVVYDGYERRDQYAGMNRYGTKRYTPHWSYSAFSKMDDTAVKKFFANKIKQIVKEEGLEWNRNNTQPCEYLDYDSGVTVRDAYRVYDKLLGRVDRITDEPPVSDEEE